MVKRVIELKGRELLTQIISKAYVFPIVGEGERAQAVEVRALWDTGATHCLVTPELAARMGLRSLGKKDNNTAGGTVEGNIYQLGLYVNERIVYPRLYFGEANGGGRFDIVIGMNALRFGCLTLEGEGDERTFRFEIP